MNNLLPKDGELIYCPKFISAEQSILYFDVFIKNINWEQKNITIYDKNIPLPRLTAWFGDDNREYTYSGVVNKPQPWIPQLIEIKDEIRKKLNMEFNSCLVNLYRSGKDHISWHSDNERELGINPKIISLSFGASRSFQVKHKFENLEKIKIDLNNGDLVLMQGSMQKKWLHRIAPTAKDIDYRINLTFRNVIS